MFEIDYDGRFDDGRSPGVIPVINKTPLEQFDKEARKPFITPTGDAGSLEIIDIQTSGDQLNIYFAGGTFRNLNPDTGGDEKVFSRMVFTIINENKIVVDLTGLYYLHPPRRNVTLEVVSEGQTVTRDIKNENEWSRNYYEEVTQISVLGAEVGNFT